MAVVKKFNTSIEDRRQIEGMNSDISKQTANISYIAMMTDVDLPTEETNNIEEETEV